MEDEDMKKIRFENIQDRIYEAIENYLEPTYRKPIKNNKDAIIGYEDKLKVFKSHDLVNVTSALKNLHEIHTGDIDEDTLVDEITEKNIEKFKKAIGEVDIAWQTRNKSKKSQIG